MAEDYPIIRIAANTSPDMRPALIFITQPLDEDQFSEADDSLKAWREFAEQEAERLYEALRNSLPGGVLDQLMVKLMQHKISLLQVKG